MDINTKSAGEVSDDLLRRVIALLHTLNTQDLNELPTVEINTFFDQALSIHGELERVQAAR